MKANSQNSGIHLEFRFKLNNLTRKQNSLIYYNDSRVQKISF